MFAHVPQLPSLVRSASQSGDDMLQLPKFGSHAHAPLTHAPVRCDIAVAAHATPHAPQLLGSVALIVHAPLHWACPAGQRHIEL